MDIVDFVSTKRDRALQVGDYDVYRKSLSRQLLAVRRRLGRATPKNAKFTPKAAVTAADIAQNHESVKLLLIPAERAWALAMHIKEGHAADDKGVAGSTRRHIISKLRKAAVHAEQLVHVLSDRSASGAGDHDLLEAKAYALCLAGAAEFEKQVSKRFEDVQAQKSAWRKCLVCFSEARVIYSALLFASPKDAYREVISGTVDPSIRYAAYQAKLSRTTAMADVAKEFFPKDDAEVTALVEKLNPTVFSEVASMQEASSPNGEITTAAMPTTISWRDRTAPVADASIGQALAVTALAAEKLSALTQSQHAKYRALAAAYDPVLNGAQEAVDAVHRAIVELVREGVPESDRRMQDLRVSDLAVNYGLISWRVGRNRVLIGGAARDDGVTFEPEHARKRAKGKKEGFGEKGADDNAHAPKPPSRARRLARLSERAALLDTTLQSIEAARRLPGAARDAGFAAQLDAQRSYFRALRCLTIAYSHQAVGAHVEALALFAHAEALVGDKASPAVTPELLATRPTGTPGLLPATDAAAAATKALLVTSAELSALRERAALLVLRQRGLVALRARVGFGIEKDETVAAGPPLVERLTIWPPCGQVDPSNLVAYPPRLAPVPVKPILLDLAWDCIAYPGHGGAADADADGDLLVVPARAGPRAAVDAVVDGDGDAHMVDGGDDDDDDDDSRQQQQQQQQPQQKRRGWFGFGR